MLLNDFNKMVHQGVNDKNVSEQKREEEEVEK